MSFKVSEGNVTITLDDGLERLARAAIDRAIPGVLELLEAEVNAIHLEARSQWPVRSGISRDGLEVVTRLDIDSGVTVTIKNDVKYVPWVRPAPWYGSETAWSRLVQKPMKALHKRLVKEIGPQIVRALAGR